MLTTHNLRCRKFVCQNSVEKFATFCPA